MLGEGLFEGISFGTDEIKGVGNVLDGVMGRGSGLDGPGVGLDGIVER